MINKRRKKTKKQIKEQKLKNKQFNNQLGDYNSMFSSETTHRGMDIFFNNIKKNELDDITKILNSMNLTMGGNEINWEVKGNIITVFYPEMSTSSEDLFFRLNKNRELFELICKFYNEKYNTSISYNGSEFYLKNVNLKKVA